MDSSKLKWRQVLLDAPNYIAGRNLTAHSVTQVGPELCIFGGLEHGFVCPTNFYMLNIQKKTWYGQDPPIELVDTQNFALFAHTATLIEDRILYIGGVIGMAGRDRSDLVFSYDMVQREFTLVETYGKLKRGATAFHSANYLPNTNAIILYGGEPAEQQFHRDPLFSLDATTLVWTRLSWTGTAPSLRANHGSCLVEKKLYIFGGFGPANVVYNDTYILDLTHRLPSFSQPNIAAPPPARFGTVMFHRHGQVFMFGGKTSLFGGMEVRLDDVCHFDMLEKQWYNYEMQDLGLPLPRSNHKIVPFKNGALIFGGTGIDVPNVLRFSFEEDSASNGMAIL